MTPAWYHDAHWTDEQLIVSLYDAGLGNDHLAHCEACVFRRSVLVGNRERVEASARPNQDLSFTFLAGQRRAIYAKLDALSARLAHRRQWAAVAVAVLILGTGAAMYRLGHPHHVAATQLSDAQLALEVSRMSQDWQTEPAAPLQGLFE
jgi:hypothetical protein